MSVWLRIDAWLEEHAPEIFAQLRPPASSDELGKLERAVGRKLPPAIVAAYLAHDGALEDATTVFGGTRVPKNLPLARFMCWLSIERVCEQLAFMKDLGDWPEERMPLAEDAGGNLLIVDLSTGEIAAFDHEDWSAVALAPDLDKWMTNLADDMDKNLVTIDEDDEDFPALMLLDKPAPRATQPAITPDRPARVLVAVMVERRMLALAKGKDLEPLIVLMTKALEIKDAEERREKVVEVLEEDTAVDDLFADDETIDALLEELG